MNKLFEIPSITQFLCAFVPLCLCFLVPSYLLCLFVAKKILLLSKFSQKLPRKRNFLTVQGDFGKIIDIVMRKLCCLRVYLGNVSYILRTTGKGAVI